MYFRNIVWRRPVPVRSEKKRVEIDKAVYQHTEGEKNAVFGSVKNSTVNFNYAQASSSDETPTLFAVPFRRNPYFSGRKQFLTQLHYQLTQNTTTAITQAQAISGLGGIGKTQTAVEYAYRYHYDQSLYQHVFWIRADTVENMTLDFVNIYSQLDLSAPDESQEEKIEKVKSWFNKHYNWLLIFDNADLPELLIDFIPKNLNGKVLLTSRASIFDQLGIQTPMALEVLDATEALDLIFERTGCNRTEANVAASLALNKELDGLPLALEQAGAFIMRKGIDISLYLSMYRRLGISQLEKEQAITGQYPSSVLRTWTINFEAVKSENVAASLLLELSAFLAPDAIPYFFPVCGVPFIGEALGSYLSRYDNDEESFLPLCELLEILSRYSLVNWEANQKTYSVHRLVQTVIRYTMTRKNSISWLSRALNIAINLYSTSSHRRDENYSLVFPHSLELNQQAKNLEYRSETLAVLQNQIGNFLESRARYSEAEQFYKSSIELRRHLLGSLNSEVIVSLYNLCHVYVKQSRYLEAESLYREVLELMHECLGAMHPDIATVLFNLAELYKLQKRYRESAELHKAALVLYNKTLGAMHPYTATSSFYLADFYFSLGSHEEARLLLEHAASTYIQTCGRSHPYTVRAMAKILKRYGQKVKDKILRENQAGEVVDAYAAPDIAYGLPSHTLLEYSTRRHDSDLGPLRKLATDLNQKILKESDLIAESSLYLLAKVYEKKGRYQEASLLFQQIQELCKLSLKSDHPHTEALQKSLMHTEALQRSLMHSESAQKSVMHSEAIQKSSMHPDSLRSDPELICTTPQKGMIQFKVFKPYTKNN